MQFFARAFYLQKPERIEALVMVMTLCLLVYALGERVIRQRLQDSERVQDKLISSMLDQAHHHLQTHVPALQADLRSGQRSFYEVELALFEVLMGLGALLLARPAGVLERNTPHLHHQGKRYRRQAIGRPRTMRGSSNPGNFL